MSGSDTIIVDGIRWELTPAGRETLSADDLKLDAHLKNGRALTVKSGEHRAVYRVALAGGAVYWKHCRLSGPRAWWRDLLRGPKAKLELDRLLELWQRGIATIEPLACGRYEGRWPKGSFLITRELAGSIPLDVQLTLMPPRTAAERRAETVALARYIHALHAAGVVHPDFHPGNLLARQDATGPSFFLIDVHDTRIGGPLSATDRRANLALWNRWFRMRTNRADRLRFYRAYSGSHATLGEAGELERLTDHSIFDLWESRDGRCLRANRHFRRSKGPGPNGFSVRELDAKLEAEIALDPDAVFARPGIQMLKDSRSSTVAVVSTERQSFVFKRFNLTTWYDSIVSLFRPSPALRSWKSGHAMLARGLTTPRPLLFQQRRRLGLPAEGYLLFERIENARNLHEAVAITGPGLTQLGDRLSRSIRVMHDRGISHRDLKAANILVTPDGECHFLDLNGVRLRRRISDRVRVRDLMRLNASFVNSVYVSHTMRLRFLRTYLLWGLHGKEGWKRWWIEIGEATRVKIARNARRNRPLA